MPTTLTLAIVPVFSPADLSPAVWLKADAITGLVDGDPVTTWEDSSTNNRDATQSTAANKPTYKTNIVNGKPVVRFDGVNDVLNTAAFTFSQPNTIALVASYTTASNFKYYFDGVSGSRHAFGDGLAAGGSHSIHAGSSVTAVQALPVAMTVWSLTFNGASSLVAKNGAAFSSGNVGTQAMGGLRLGANLTGADLLVGDIAEIVICNSALGATDLGNLEDHLGAKYGIAIA